MSKVHDSSNTTVKKITKESKAKKTGKKCLIAKTNTEEKFLGIYM